MARAEAGGLFFHKGLDLGPRGAAEPGFDSGRYVRETDRHDRVLGKSVEHPESGKSVSRQPVFEHTAGRGPP